MNINDKVKEGDRFYGAEGTPANFGRGRTVRNFIGATYRQMIDQGWYLYVASVIPATHKANGIVIDVDHATQGTVLLTPEEIAAIAEQDALTALIATDAYMTRTVEDTVESLLAAGITLLPELPTKLANKKAARSAYLALV